MRHTSLIFVGALALLGCKTQDEALVGKPPAGGEALVAKPAVIDMNPTPAPRGTAFAPPLLAVATWPYADDRTTFRLTWKGGDHALPLHEQPDPNSDILGEVVWSNGEVIRWVNTLVAVYEPVKMRAKDEWFVEGPVFDTGYQTDVDFVSETVPKGRAVDVYLYAGAGQCYLGLEGKIFTGVCPPADKFHGKFEGDVVSRWYQPMKMVWWIQITTGPVTGWIPVDQRIAVDVEPA